jgi:hypothetical protein
MYDDNNIKRSDEDHDARSHQSWRFSKFIGLERRWEVRRLLTEFRSSERHVRKLMKVPGSSGRYRSRRDESQIQEQLWALAREHLRFGYRRQYLYLRISGIELLNVNSDFSQG